MNINKAEIGFNQFCGPAVLSILTGRSTNDCAFVISSITGKNKVRGITTRDLLRAADVMGFSYSELLHYRDRTLFATITGLINYNGIYVIASPKHFVVVEILDKKAYFCDNHTKEPIPAASSARLSMKVESVHKVFPRIDFEKPPAPKLPVVVSSVIVIKHIRVITYDNGRTEEKLLSSITANEGDSIDIGRIT